MNLLKKRNTVQSSQHKGINRILLWIIVFTLILGVLWSGVMWAKIYDPLPTHPEGLPRAEKLPGITNILVVGTDNFYDLVGRADTIMILSLEEETQNISLVSVPRDSYVEIPGQGLDRINSTMLTGGVLLLRSTLEELLGIPLDYYIYTNLAGFERMVNAMGGITVNVLTPMRVRTTIPEHKWYDLEPGQTRMDGKLALAYLRFRSDREVDFGRTNRQRNFIMELVKQSLRPSKVLRAPFMIAAASDAVRTDISVSKSLQWVKVLRSTDLQGISMIGLKGTPRIVDGKAIVYLDMEYLESVMDQYVRRSGDYQ